MARSAYETDLHSDAPAELGFVLLFGSLFLVRTSAILLLFVFVGCDDEDTILEATAPTCDGGSLDEATNLCWQHPAANETFSFQEGIDYCDDLSLGGQDDWRLPTITEYTEILGWCDPFDWDVGMGGCDHCGLSETCTALFGTETRSYWSTPPLDSGIEST